MSDYLYLLPAAAIVAIVVLRRGRVGSVSTRRLNDQLPKPAEAVRVARASPVEWPPLAIPASELAIWQRVADAPELDFSNVAFGQALWTHGPVFPDGSQRARLCFLVGLIPVAVLGRYVVRTIGPEHYEFLAERGSSPWQKKRSFRRG